LNATHNLHNV